VESSEETGCHLITFKRLLTLVKQFIAIAAIFIGTFLTIIGAVYISVGLEVLNSTQCADSKMVCPSGFGSQIGGGFALAIGLAIIVATVSPFLYNVLKSPTEKGSETKQDDSVKPIADK